MRLVFPIGFLLLASLANVWGYSYLILAPTASKSHYTVMSSLAKGLAAAGHEVTYISPFSQSKPVKNLTEITTPNVIEAMKVSKSKILQNTKLSIWKRYPVILAMGLKITNTFLEEPKVMAFMKEKRTFDAVIVEVFMNEAHFGFAELFNASLITVSTFGASTWTTDLVGTPSPPSYVPHLMTELKDRMSFLERAINLAFISFEFVYLKWFSMPRQHSVYHKHFPDNKLDFHEMQRNTALVLLNSHVSLNFPRPYAPNMIEVGGMHINYKTKQLPKDIEEFINGAEHGVIYFSLGSNVRSKDLPLEKRKAIVETLKGLKQRVLWKFEESNFAEKPNNVFISDWFPQDDILAHDKVIAFITHGGLLSTTESIYHGKPVIGIPIFGDQFTNMARAVQSGYGASVKYSDLTYERLHNAIKAVITDPSYTEKVRAMSRRFRDQKETPLQRAIYWIEHVSREKGAQYLRSACQDLNFVQYHNLDVFALFFGILLSILVALTILTNILVRFLKTKLGNSKVKHKKL
ncbi:uncharacterized protein Dwil_GK13997 [Drosophila willistoni]|uniref:UDP-glucuronosyltransferase n=1 Tax=Drosophila willistoni TaxID=7260 RepID=B4NKX8_DROWI|nr:UDP-glucosyltransferase 2 [Drosophila willistoni]EDW84181.2 uncharacterized protein Dwil_GK13997 [Drosophila willistoni]